MFFSYLTIVPSMAYFLIQMETDFFVRYNAYYMGIQNQENMHMLEKRRREILRSLADNFEHIVLIQGIISGVTLIAVPLIVKFARMDPLQMGVLRIGIFAAFLQIGVLICINVLLYFDFRREALIASGVFCLSNLTFTLISTLFGLPAYGFGYTAACFVSLVVSIYYLNERLRLLHYWTFSRQQIPIPVVVTDDSDEL